MNELENAVNRMLSSPAHEKTKALMEIDKAAAKASKYEAQECCENIGSKHEWLKNRIANMNAQARNEKLPEFIRFMKSLAGFGNCRQN